LNISDKAKFDFLKGSFMCKII